MFRRKIIGDGIAVYTGRLNLRLSNTRQSLVSRDLPESKTFYGGIGRRLLWDSRLSH